MKKLKFGPSFAVFVIFFALALIEAAASQNWPIIGIFAALGGLSLVADLQ